MIVLFFCMNEHLGCWKQHWRILALRFAHSFSEAGTLKQVQKQVPSMTKPVCVSACLCAKESVSLPKDMVVSQECTDLIFVQFCKASVDFSGAVTSKRRHQALLRNVGRSWNGEAKILE